MNDNHCIVCKRLSDELLVLSCQHDPCIDCVAKQYFQSPKNQLQLMKKGEDFYLCSICFEFTKLDSSTVEELKKYVERKKKMQKQNIRMKNSPRNNNQFRDPEILFKTPKECSTSSSHPNSPKFLALKELRESQISDIMHYNSEDENLHIKYSPRMAKHFCKKHTDQQKTFYCFNCYKNICAECAIHGAHFGHEVHAVKKAATKLKKVYNQVLSEVQKYENALTSQFKQLSKVIASFRQWNVKQREGIRDMFRGLYQSLAEREQKLQKEIDQAERQGLTLLESNKMTYEKLAGELSFKKKKVLSNLDLEPMNWDIEELDNEKQQLKKIISEKLSPLSASKQTTKKLSSDLVMEAIETIEDLVDTFQLTIHKQ